MQKFENISKPVTSPQKGSAKNWHLSLVIWKKFYSSQTRWLMLISNSDLAIAMLVNCTCVLGNRKIVFSLVLQSMWFSQRILRKNDFLF